MHLRIEAANGSFNFLLPTDYARSLAEHLTQRADEVSDIVVPKIQGLPRGLRRQLGEK